MRPRVALRVASDGFKIYEMQISRAEMVRSRNGRERKFLATIISPSSGLYRAIIESLKAGGAVNGTPPMPSGRLTSRRFKRRNAAANAAGT